MPVINIALVGEHAAATWNEVNLSPPGALARESMFGVWISEPKVLQSLKPRSSATIIRKFGGIGAVFRFGLVVLELEDSEKMRGPMYLFYTILYCR